MCLSHKRLCRIPFRFDGSPRMGTNIFNPLVTVRPELVEGRAHGQVIKEGSMIKGKVTLGKGWVRQVSFEGFDGPIASAANPDMAQLGIQPESPTPDSFHLIVAALAS